MKKFQEQLAEILMKIFQIIFGMLVVGMVLREHFEPVLFTLGVLLSSVVLAFAIQLYYNANVKEGK